MTRRKPPQLHVQMSMSDLFSHISYAFGQLTQRMCPHASLTSVHENVHITNFR